MINRKDLEAIANARANRENFRGFLQYAIGLMIVVLVLGVINEGAMVAVAFVGMIPVFVRIRKVNKMREQIISELETEIDSYQIRYGRDLSGKLVIQVSDDYKIKSK